MDLNKLTLFKMVDVERSYLSERQKVLAANVANANTPGFLPKDVTKPDFSREIEKDPQNDTGSAGLRKVRCKRGGKDKRVNLLF